MSFLSSVPEVLEVSSKLVDFEHGALSKDPADLFPKLVEGVLDDIFMSVLFNANGLLVGSFTILEKSNLGNDLNFCAAPNEKDAAGVSLSNDVAILEFNEDPPDFTDSFAEVKEDALDASVSELVADFLIKNGLEVDGLTKLGKFN
mmetsp:Transcript_2232/g.2705  ORF Transcript_2232/g.2705 Transcript_2232/m.2705 type:complete len:146 (-) Transcript_2232:758-1195(-)